MEKSDVAGSLGGGLPKELRSYCFTNCADFGS